MKDFYEIVASRQSDRAYDSSKSVDIEVVKRIVEAARLAPSACNSQPWHFIIVNNPDLCHDVSETLTDAGANKFSFQAPVHIILVQESPNFAARIGGWVKNKHFPWIDCGIAISNITLAATAEGLGSCVLGWFNEKKLKKVLNIPSSKRILVDIIIGYSAQPHREKIRKSFDDICTINTY